jgi:hypothetical protein
VPEKSETVFIEILWFQLIHSIFIFCPNCGERKKPTTSSSVSLKIFPSHKLSSSLSQRKLSKSQTSKYSPEDISVDLTPVAKHISLSHGWDPHYLYNHQHHHAKMHGLLCKVGKRLQVQIDTREKFSDFTGEIDFSVFLNRIRSETT